jgi:hypothetical protein
MFSCFAQNNFELSFANIFTNLSGGGMAVLADASVFHPRDLGSYLSVNRIFSYFVGMRVEFKFEGR